MKNQIIFKPLLLIITLIFTCHLNAQPDSILHRCSRFIQTPYISDGQQYKALVSSNEEVAEFRSIFYGESIYRIAACGSVPEGKMHFSVYDAQRNLLFTNTEYENSPYWDFKFESTIECIIEAKFAEDTNTSGFIILLIGFKQ